MCDIKARKRRIGNGSSNERAFSNSPENSHIASCRSVAIPESVYNCVTFQVFCSVSLIYVFIGESSAGALSHPPSEHTSCVFALALPKHTTKHMNNDSILLFTWLSFSRSSSSSRSGKYEKGVSRNGLVDTRLGTFCDVLN